MNRKLIAVLALTIVLSGSVVLAQPFGGGQCYVGPGLAATLLFPYFEVDTANPLGVGTLLAINNGLDSSTLVRVVVWTDWGIPTLAFDMFLEGFDAETINVGDLLNGNLPSTGMGVNLSGFPNCDLAPPFHANPVLSSDERAQLVADHLGVMGPQFGTCVGSPHPDQIARGYITVDVVDECSGVEGGSPDFTPENTSRPYFAESNGAAGIARVSNRLWGDLIYVDFSDNSAQGSEAVPIWANSARFQGSGHFTFYGRFSGWDARDERVPLPTIWNQRFLNGGPFAGGADLIVWRDPGELTDPGVCGAVPPPFPLNDLTTILDLDGNGVPLVGDENFPLATQRVSIDSLNLPFTFGWLQIDLSPGSVGLDGRHQAWVQPSLNANNLFSANFNGTPVAFLCGTTPPDAIGGTEKSSGAETGRQPRR